MQQGKKNTAQQSNQRAQETSNNGSNVWNFNEFKKGTEAWNKAWTDMFAHNGNSEKWNQTFNQGNKNFSSWMTAWNQCTTTCSEAATEYTQTWMQKCTEGQTQCYAYWNQCGERYYQFYGEYVKLLQSSFNCRTQEQCASWTQECTTAAQEFYRENCAQAAQASVDCQERIGQPLIKQAFNWQDRCWKAWSKYAKNTWNF